MTNTTLVVQSVETEWTQIDPISCTQCLDHTSEHIDEMLMCLFKVSSIPKIDLIYQQVAKIINKTFSDDQQHAKEIRQQVRKLINERLIETAQYVCLKNKTKIALQPIAEELLMLPRLLSINKEIRIASFDRIEHFGHFYGSVEISNDSCGAIQPFQRNSLVMLLGRNLYTTNQVKSIYEVCLRIKHFESNIRIGICSNNVSPNDIEEASNTFPIDPSPTTREGDIFHLSIDIEQYTICLWQESRSRSHQNREPHKRERTISRQKCPLPWRYFVILTGRNSHVRIVY